MAAGNSQFESTRNLFRKYLDSYSDNGRFTKIPYDVWKNADEDDKSSLLFVIFYDAIILAWYKCITSCRLVYVDSESGVSIILQYLMKNVAKINEDEKRYTSNYIYTVSYNCLAKFASTQVCDIKRSTTEISNEYTEGDTTVNLWDLLPAYDEDFETVQTKEAIWNIISHMGPKAEKVVNHLINPGDTYHKLSKSVPGRELDRLADVAVSKKEYAEILEDLKLQLAPFADTILGI